MAKLTKVRLENILNARLSLKSPEYFLERVGDRLVGNIVSPSFRGKGDYKRQEMISEALEAELGDQFFTKVGMLLAYTPDEWHIGEPEKVRPRRPRKAS